MAEALRLGYNNKNAVIIFNESTTLNFEMKIFFLRNVSLRGYAPKPLKKPLCGKSHRWILRFKKKYINIYYIYFQN